MADYGSRAYDEERARANAALAELGFTKWGGALNTYLCKECSSLVVSNTNLVGLRNHNRSLHSSLDIHRIG